MSVADICMSVPESACDESGDSRNSLRYLQGSVEASHGTTCRGLLLSAVMFDMFDYSSEQAVQNNSAKGNAIPWGGKNMCVRSSI